MRKALVLIAIMTSLLLAEHLSLIELWKYKVRSSVYGIAFSGDGYMGVASGNLNSCAYVFDVNGNMLNSVCGSSWMYDASYSNKMFAFINFDGYVYITSKDGVLLKKIYIGEQYSRTVVLRDNKFIVCGYRCALFDLEGNKLWDIDVGYVFRRPSYYKGYWYAADRGWYKLLIIKDGKIIKEISYSEKVFGTAVCGHYLVMSTWSHVYLYNILEPSRPKLIWKKGGLDAAAQVTFSPDCRYIAVADAGNHNLRIYDINGNPITTIHYGDRYDDKVWAVAWWKDRIAAGLEDGRIYVYKVEGYEPFFLEAYTTTTVMRIKVPITIITTIEVPVTVTITVPR